MKEYNKEKDPYWLFICEITDKVWAELSDEKREKLKTLGAFDSHFVFGASIRNKYIHNDERCKNWDADNLSGTIVGKLKRRARGENEDVDPMELLMFTF